MDLSSTLISAFISVTLALGLVSSFVQELHCYNLALKDYRRLALEESLNPAIYFSECRRNSLRMDIASCVHKQRQVLMLVEG